MYCSFCGAEVIVGSKYCKRCGANFNLPAKPTEGAVSPAKLTGMTWAIAIMVVGGLGVIFGCMIPLIAIGTPFEFLLPLSGFGLLTIVTITALLIRQLSRLVRIAESAEEQDRMNRITERSLPQPTLPRPVPSVTEHTTRNFDQYAEQRERQ